MQYFEVLNDFQANDGTSMITTKLILGSLLVFQQGNAAIYGLIFYKLYQHEISMSKILRADEVKRRIKRDVRTFSLEFYGYLIENILVIALLITSRQVDLVIGIGIGACLEFTFKSLLQLKLCWHKH